MVFSVTVGASGMVQPAVPPLGHPHFPSPVLHATIPPSNLDQVVAQNFYAATVHFFHRPPPAAISSLHVDNFFSCDNVLLPSLRRALYLFYPFAGTLAPDLTILCNGNGALFVEALADCCIADLGDLLLCPDPWSLWQLVPKADESQDITSRPLLRIQVTQFTCGGAAFGMALSHCVADGASACNFLKVWTSLARGETVTSFPDFDRAWLQARSPPTPQFVHEEYSRFSLPLTATSTEGQNSVPHCVDSHNEIVVQIFDLPPEFLQELKLISSGKFSTYEMLAAHVWKCSCEARMLAHNVESLLCMPVDGRGRLKGISNNPRNYVGNVIFDCSITLSVGEILQSSTATLTGKVHEALTRMDDGYCRSAIDFLETHIRGTDGERNMSCYPTFEAGILFVTWAKLPLGDIDFGWGKAKDMVRLPQGRCREGRATLFASHQAGGLRLYTALQRRHMKTFAQLLLSCSPTPPNRDYNGAQG